ncbi:MAG: DUF1837 domain-containing protein [Chromatiaceae bacterium]|nr:DUF1837 domain-containing protein [Chromatiaceae bacterium]MCP5439736.1 DUF1837 domain-containing protein [Chromatiaceae bacterium]
MSKDETGKADNATPTVKPFLQVRVSRLEPEAELVGFCAGYEGGAWRSDAFARYLIRNLPQFALPLEEWERFDTATGVEQLGRAARAIYTTKKYQNRGEVGELLLFSIMRDYYQSEPVVSKFYFKSSSNETVKGFDGVHVVSGQDGLELWLGEVKFYTQLSAAVRDVLAELSDHLEYDYLRDEFMWIEHKMGDGCAHSDEIRQLLDDSTSLDEVFKHVHIPVLLTYRSKTVECHSVVDDQYKEEIASELSKHFDSFRQKELPGNVGIHLILVPLAGKAKLLRSFDDRLKGLQQL